MKEIDNINVEFKNRSTGCFKDKTKAIHYLLNGEYHRVDGPSCIWEDGTSFYRQHNAFHREDGPAIEGGNLYSCWYWYGARASSKSEWLDPIFRRKAELKRYL